MITVNIELKERHLGHVWTIGSVELRAGNSAEVPEGSLPLTLREEYKSPEATLDHAKRMAVRKISEKWRPSLKTRSAGRSFHQSIMTRSSHRLPIKITKFACSLKNWTVVGFLRR